MTAATVQPNNLITAAEAAMQRYIAEARHAGVPQDQLLGFARHGYVALPHQLQFHAVARQCDAPDGPVMVGFGGKRGPGKTHGAFAQVALDDCQRFPGAKFLFLRKVAKSAKESMQDLRRRVLHSTEHRWRENDGLVSFPNESRIVTGHFHNENDVDQYLGIEYDGAVVEEANTLSAMKLDMVRGSIRSSKPGWRPRLYLTFNPGGIGHQNMRTMFILPWRKQQETRTRFVPGGHNPYLNPEYQAWLDGLAGALGKMWRDGDWDVAGGAFFTNWNYAAVVRPALERVPAHWRVWLAMDYGYHHYTVIYLLALDDQGNLWVLDEHAQRQWLIPQHATALDAMLARNGVQRHQISTFVAGHDVFAKRHDGSTIADQWTALGWRLDRATVDRVNGAAEVARRLGNPEAGIRVTLRISERCGGLIECLPLLLSDAKRPDDVLKVDTDSNGQGGDDWYDGFRYGAMEANQGQGVYI